MDLPERNFSQAVEELDRLSDIESKKWFLEHRKVGAFWAVRSSAAAFWKAYFTQKGHRQGIRGLFFAVHAGMLLFLTYAKYWELGRDQKKNA